MEVLEVPSFLHGYPKKAIFWVHSFRQSHRINMGTSYTTFRIYRAQTRSNIHTHIICLIYIYILYIISSSSTIYYWITDGYLILWSIPAFAFRGFSALVRGAAASGGGHCRGGHCRAGAARIGSSDLGAKSLWLFSDGQPKLEVPTIYKAYVRPKFQGISPQNMAKHMVQYLHFRILKFTLIWWGYIWVNEIIFHEPEFLGHLGMISLINHDSRVRENSEVVIIYPVFFVF